MMPAKIVTMFVQVLKHVSICLECVCLLYLLVMI